MLAVAPQAPQVPVAHVARCRTHSCWRRESARRHRRYWHRLYLAMSSADRTWSRCIAYWETLGVRWSRKASVNTGNGFGGGVQFSLSTALAAGFRPKPTRTRPTLATVTMTTLDEQLVRAVGWRDRTGPSQWPRSSRHC